MKRLLLTHVPVGRFPSSSSHFPCTSLNLHLGWMIPSHGIGRNACTVWPHTILCGNDLFRVSLPHRPLVIKSSMAGTPINDFLPIVLDTHGYYGRSEICISWGSVEDKHRRIMKIRGGILVHFSGSEWLSWGWLWRPRLGRHSLGK